MNSIFILAVTNDHLVKKQHRMLRLMNGFAGHLMFPSGGKSVNSNLKSGLSLETRGESP